MGSTEIVGRLRDVVFSYRRRGEENEEPVLDGLSVDLPEQSFVAVMGASGGGKSTLLRTLNGLVPGFLEGPFEGEVSVLGRDATTTPPHEMADDVGMVMQDYEAQLFGTSVASEVAFGLENLAVPVTEMDDRTAAALSAAGLTDLSRSRPPDSLSGGQKQRLVFAGVLAMHPEVLVLDEPTSDLDPSGSREIGSILARLADAARSEATVGDWHGPRSVVLVTHDIETALLADHAVLLADGGVARSGPAETVFRDADTLRNSRVDVPPLVDAFDRLGFETPPVTVDEAVRRFEESGLSWTPPARRGEPLPGVPGDTAREPGDPVFEVTDLVHRYETGSETIRAVDGVSLTVREGEAVAVVGHNGSGKTTLVKHLNGLVTPDEGTVRWNGTRVAELSTAEIGRRVGFVFQNPDHQIFASTVREEVAFGPENFGYTGAELDQRVGEAITTVGLDGMEDADPFALSKGQRQRVALASVLATEPETILFDEPTTGLDASQQTAFMDLVAELNRTDRLTVVMVTHDMATVAAYAPRTVVLRDGRKVADAPTRELFADEERLAAWELRPPQPVALSNRLGGPEALPALSVGELVAGLADERREVDS